MDNQSLNNHQESAPYYEAPIQYPQFHEDMWNHQPQQQPSANLEQSNYAPAQDSGYIPPTLIEPNPNVIILYDQIPTITTKIIRVEQIDMELESSFPCYRCWLWFGFVFSVCGFVMTIMTVSNSRNKRFLGLLIYSVVSSFLSVMTYYIGITSLKYKSYERNILFKAMLLFVLLLHVGYAIWFYTLDGTENLNAEGPMSILGFLVIMLLFMTADKVGMLLEERRELISRPQERGIW